MIILKFFIMLLVIYLMGYGLAWLVFWHEMINYISKETKDDISYDDYTDMVINDMKENSFGKPLIIILMILPFALLKSNKKISSKLFPQEYED